MMKATANPPRHGALFEFLRRQSLSEHAARRLGARERDQIEAARAAAFLALALRSWEQPSPAAVRAAAPEPRRHNEFFRTVRA